MRERAQRPTAAWGGTLRCALPVQRPAGRDAREIVSPLTGCEQRGPRIASRHVENSLGFPRIDVGPGGGHAFMITACGVDHRCGLPDGTSGRRRRTVNGVRAGISVGAATRAPRLHPVGGATGTVTHELDQQMEVAPSTALSKGGRGHWLPGPCSGGPVGRPRTLNRKTGGDVHQGTRARTYTHSTPPWCQQPHARVGWPFGGVLVLPERTSSRSTPLLRGAGMT